jgi:hypothetical protein
VETRSRDLANRARGLKEEIRSRANEGEVDDSVLEERVRARLGHVADHPSAISVASDHGRITLSGDILQWELNHVLEGIAGVPGVKSIENRILVHDSAENIPSLQGEGRLPRSSRFGRWSAGRTILAGAAGGALLYGMARARNRQPEARWRRIAAAIPKYGLGLTNGSRARRAACAAGALTFYGWRRMRRGRMRPTGWRRLVPDVNRLTRALPSLSTLRRGMPAMSTLKRVPGTLAQTIPWVH